MTISNDGKKLLIDIFSASFESLNGMDALRFRADNEQLISELDQLEHLGYIERKNDRYFITPLALAQLARESPTAGRISYMCSLVFTLLRGIYKDNPGQKITVSDISKNTNLSEDDVRVSLRVIIQTRILGSYSNDLSGESAYVAPSESILKYKSFEDILQEIPKLAKLRDSQYRKSKKLTHISPKYQVGQDISLFTNKTNWEAIENEYDVNKRNFGRKINFVSDSHKREIIFRDVEHSFVLAFIGFSKPAVILAGGVIEELLRLYLKHNNITPPHKSFDDYIKTCEKNRLLKSGISRLSDSVRYFRNLVHLSAEKTKKHAISKATAKGALSSIFTIVNDF